MLDNKELIVSLKQKLSGIRGNSVPTIIVPNKGIKERYGRSLYSIYYVYSNKGNFILKGFHRECDEFLELLKKNRFVYFFYFQGSRKKIDFSMDYWGYYRDEVNIHRPGVKKLRIDSLREGIIYENKYSFVTFLDKKGIVTSNFKIRRFPRKWIPEMEFKRLFPNYEKDSKASF